MYDLAFVRRKSETIPCCPFLYGINCLLQMSLYGVHGAATKTDFQVVNKECTEDVSGDTRWQLIDLQPKACNNQYTPGWDTFFRVEFIRECGADSDPNSAVPEI